MPVDIFDIGFQTAKETSEERKQRLKDAKDIQKLADKFISDRTERSFSLLMKRCNWGCVPSYMTWLGTTMTRTM